MALLILGGKMEIETVKITTDVTDQNQLGYVIINKSDLTEEHTLFDEDAGKKKAKNKGSDATTEGE
jgi:hypothetical protein